MFAFNNIEQNDIQEAKRETILPIDTFRQELYFIKDNTTSPQRAEFLISGYFETVDSLIGLYGNQLTLECHKHVMKVLCGERCDFTVTIPKVISFGRINSHDEIVPCRLVIDGNTRIGISYIRDLEIEAINLGYIGNVGDVRNVHELTNVLANWLRDMGMPDGSCIINRSSFYREIGLELKA